MLNALACSLQYLLDDLQNYCLGTSVASKGSKGHPSAPVQLRLRPSTFAVATDTTTGEPFSFFLA